MEKFFETVKRRVDNGDAYVLHWLVLEVRLSYKDGCYYVEQNTHHGQQPSFVNFEDAVGYFLLRVGAWEKQ